MGILSRVILIPLLLLVACGPAPASRSGLTNEAEPIRLATTTAGFANEPVGQIDTSADYSCDLRASGTTSCQGGDRYGKAPDSVFTQLSASASSTCGIRLDQSLECWGQIDSAAQPAPTDRFLQIDEECGVRIDQSLACWGSSANVALPQGPFQQVSMDLSQGCGLRTTGTLACWGEHQHIPQSSRFKAVGVGYNFSCAIDLADALVCWSGPEMIDAIKPPEGTFVQLSVGAGDACAIRIDQALLCWDEYGVIAADRLANEALPSDDEALAYGPLPIDSIPPSGSFTQVSVGGILCALRTDGTIDCWGANDSGTPPAGKFAQVRAGLDHACALRVDGGAVCWGNTDSQPWAPAATGSQR